ncbi:MAG TPA: hypothetical protein VE978_03440 [Chitinophagales bacterium]|nr:hypothetical protein [Chitinophagales bacterium]
MKAQLKKYIVLGKVIMLMFGLVIFGSSSAVAQIDTSSNKLHQNQLPPAKPNPQTNPNPNPNQQPTHVNPNPNANPAYPATPQKVPMDTLKNSRKHIPPDNGSSNPNPGQQKLTGEQLKAIVGKDTKVGVDPNGNQLYKEPGGRTYFVNEEGTKVYVK